MVSKAKDRNRHKRGLQALLQSSAGNTLAIMAAAMLPMSMMVGSAVDMARLYVVKVRLQQACDAGALAGRKFMTGDALDANATQQAQNFFSNNFRSGWFSTATPVFKVRDTTDHQVHGDASVTVPMTIMKMIGKQPVTLNVSCEARYEVADTDVMFVLDVTGSMACLPTDDENTCNNYVGAAGTVKYNRPDGTTGYYVPEKNGSRISALRTAVLNFYDTLASSVDPTTHVRYGFVTYTSTVNAGLDVYGLSSSYMVNKWTYPTRWVTGDYVVRTNSSKTVSASSSTACAAYYSRTPSTPLTYNANGTATAQDPVWTTGRNGSTCTLNNDTIGPVWTYGAKQLDTSQYITGSTVTDPTRVDSSTSKWQGCIEERNTTQGAMTFDQNNLPPDLDPDLIPSGGQNQWRPMWPDVVYARNSNNGIYSRSTASDTSNGDDYTHDPAMDYPSPMQYGYQTCGKRVQRLAVMTRADVSNYVNATDFRAIGGTYHDTGMIWGTRMISPNGIFKNDTAAWSGRTDPHRVIVFMTDGDMAPNQYIYGMYGIEYFDRRVTGGDFGNIKDYHNARFLAECAAAKARGIDVWVVAVGQSLTDQLKSCASKTSQALYAGSGQDLKDAFQLIAKQVALLQLSK